MKIKDVIHYLETEIPTAYAENFDNVGLLVGNAQDNVTGVLVCLDTLETVVDEAIERQCNLIVSFHPIIFKGLKKLTGASYVERTVLKAIKHDISIYAIHTALDNFKYGVNYQIGKKLNLINQEILIPQSSTIKKLTTYVPNQDVKQVKQALFDINAGKIGNYSHCSFDIEGIGNFKPEENSNPTEGERHKLHRGKETQVNITFLSHLESKIIKTLKEIHPYEEVAYEIETLENENQDIGIGMVGDLKEALDMQQTLELIKKVFNPSGIRTSKPHQTKVKRIAVLGGSGAFGIPNAIRKQADIYLTADLKYHDFFRAENNITLVDVGHYESEQYTKELICAILQKKFHNFAIVLSNTNTNPIQYY